MIDQIDLYNFKNNEIKAKSIFYLKQINKQTSFQFIKKYHYLGDAKFFCIIAYGIFYKKTNQLVGCATYSMPQGTQTTKSWFNLPSNTQNIFQLSRLCVLPILNGTNATSFLLGGSIRQLQKLNHQRQIFYKKNKLEFKKQDLFCRAVITLACSQRHVGSIYQVCNFKYYGKTKQASDFYRQDGKINPRGKPSQWNGVYLSRPIKHRYAYILDETLICNYKQQKKPSLDQIYTNYCCGGTKKVYDNRFDIWYTCPRCTGQLKRLTKIQQNNNYYKMNKNKLF